ncbi:MAG: ABC transporter permease [Myxococcota bacterium]
MTTYIVKRILLMIPTFLLILVVVFGILQLAPGRPAPTQGGDSGVEQAGSTESRESYRMFKEQFNFDKPVFFNTRFGLETEPVRSELAVLADQRLPVCPEQGEKPDNCIPASESPSSAAVIDARNRLEDWGSYIVPQLLEIAENADRTDVRVLAVNQLSVNAQVDLQNEFGSDQTAEQIEFNQKAFRINNKLSQWTLSLDVSPQQVDATVEEKWEPWLAENRERFEYNFGEKVDVFFTDTRFAKYLGNLARLDFGTSHVDRRPVLPTLIEKVKVSLTLSVFAILLAYLISVPLGIWSAYNQHSTADQAMTALLFMLYSLPSFFTAVLLVEFFASGSYNYPFTEIPMKLFPTGDFVSDNAENLTTLEYIVDVGHHMILPVFCLTYGALASLSRYARTGLLDVIRADYIRTARAKGLSEPMVILKHAVRNGMIPILTLLGTLLPALVSGSVVIEYVFNLPGMGLYLLQSIFQKDYNAIMAISLVSTVLTLVGILLSDISYAIVDPRISFD